MSQYGLQEMEARLAQWAYYKINLNEGGIGWPSRNLIITLSEGRGPRYPTTGVCLILKFDHSQQTDTWVKAMGKLYPDLEDALTVYYTCKLPPRKIAALLGVSARTLQQRVHDAKLWLCGRLNAYLEAQDLAQKIG